MTKTITLSSPEVRAIFRRFNGDIAFNIFNTEKINLPEGVEEYVRIQIYNGKFGITYTGFGNGGITHAINYISAIATVTQILNSIRLVAPELVWE